MFAELPKLFDRNFAIGFFLPFALAAAASLYLLDCYGLSGVFLPALQKDLIVGGTIFGIVCWLGGILLLVTNRDLYRILEGYGKFNPSRLFTWLEQARYHHLNNEIKKLDAEIRKYLDAGVVVPKELKTKRNQITIELVERFPDQERLIPLTPFGNTLRAFETYPMVMYGLESIDGWSRLLAVVPTDYRNLIDGAKAQVDFWVNLFFMSLILVIGSLSLFGIYRIMPPLWLLVIVVFILLISPSRARRLAVEWGDFVKGAFDVYRFKLLDSLSIKRPETRKEEFETWKNFSQAIVFRLPDQIPELKKPVSQKIRANRVLRNNKRTHL